MAIAVFVVMIVITLAGMAYPLFGAATALRPAVSSAAAAGCSSCGRLLTEDELFCPQCGAPAGHRCASCGRALDADDVYCPGCGKKVGV
jgi:RNA polymerase subunit RPABC4/transcription elongation factor Spt4